MSAEGPHPFARKIDPVDQLVRRAPSWDDIEAMINPAKLPDGFRPDDKVKRFIARMMDLEDGRLFLEWIADLTTRAPYPHVGSTRDSVMIAAAKHEARVAVGWACFRAAEDGDKLIKEETAR